MARERATAERTNVSTIDNTMRLLNTAQQVAFDIAHDNERSAQAYIAAQIAEAQRVMSAMLADAQLIATVEAAAWACASSLKNGGKVLLAGNGGSAADAQHIAGELVSRFAFDRPGLAAIALTTDTSILTAIGN